MTFEYGGVVPGPKTVIIGSEHDPVVLMRNLERAVLAAKAEKADPVDLPTDRLRQLRDGHDPDQGTVGKARTARIARLQQEIIAAGELAVELDRYRVAAAGAFLKARPDIIRLVDREVRRMSRDAVAHRDRLDQELRALQ